MEQLRERAPLGEGGAVVREKVGKGDRVGRYGYRYSYGAARNTGLSIDSSVPK